MILIGDRPLLYFKFSLGLPYCFYFDSVPDIAITTSFGLADLYIDYLVYDTIKKKYSYVGNFTQFNIHNNKILSNVVKISAAKYKNMVYSWKGFKLTRKLNDYCLLLLELRFQALFE